MSPSAVLRAIELILDALLLTLRQQYKPTFQQAGSYKYGSVLRTEDEELRMHYSAIYNGELMTCFHKTVSLLLFHLVPKDKLREYQPDVKAIADMLREHMADWATARSAGLIGHYYQPDDLRIELVEELPDVFKLVRRVEEMLFVDKTTSVQASCFGIAGETKPLLVDFVAVKRTLSSEISTKMEFMQWSGTQVVETEVPLYSGNRILGWAEIPVRLEISNDPGPMAGEKPVSSPAQLPPLDEAVDGF